MGKSIILIHGRHFKPNEEDLKTLWLDALAHALAMDVPAIIPAYTAATKAFVSNRLIAQARRLNSHNSCRAIAFFRNYLQFQR